MTNHEAVGHVELRKQIRHQLALIGDGMRNSPAERWLPIAYSNLTRLDRAASQYPPDVRDFVREQIALAKLRLLEQFACRNPAISDSMDASAIAHSAESIIYEISREMAAPFCEKPPEGISHRTTTISDLIAHRSDILTQREVRVRGVIRRVIEITVPKTGEVLSLTLPESENVLYKGGIPRLMLNLLADSPNSMIDGELPWNDLDAIGIGDSHKTRIEACGLGVDAEGVEMLGREMDWDEYCLGRDTDHNQTLLGRDVLHYSDDALRAARTGHITLNGLYMPNRALYGTDTFLYDELELGTPRGLMRLIKPLAERKAISFAYHPANRHVDCAPYFLFLARKWSKKPDFPILLQRGLEIGRLMGQIRIDEFDPYKILDEMHARVPRFDLGAEMRDPRDVAVWKGSKIVRQIDRELTWRFHFPGDLEIPGEDIAAPLITISLDSFTPSEEISEQIIKGWNDFKAHCAARVAEENLKPTDPADRYFLRNQAWLQYLR